MSFPNITLKIENHIPSVIYNADKNISREMIKAERSLEELIKELGQDLDLEENSIEDLMTLTEHGVERLIEELPKLNKYSNEFEIEKTIKTQTEDLKEKRENYEGPGVTREVLDELMRNQNIDILSSIVELIFNILIAKTVMVSSELGIGNIVLEDKNNYFRLQSKMASELSKMEIKLQIKN